MSTNGSAPSGDRAAARRQVSKALLMVAALEIVITLVYVFFLHKLTGIAFAGGAVVLVVWAMYLRVKAR